MSGYETSFPFLRNPLFFIPPLRLCQNPLFCASFTACYILTLKSLFCLFPGRYTANRLTSSIFFLSTEAKPHPRVEESGVLQAQRDYLSGCCGKSHFNLNIHSMQRQGVKKKWMKFRVFQLSIRITLAQLCFNQTLDRSLLLIKSPAGRKGGLSYLSHSATLHHYHWIYQCNMERMHLRRRLMAAAAKSPAGAQRRPLSNGH